MVTFSWGYPQGVIVHLYAISSCSKHQGIILSLDLIISLKRSKLSMVGRVLIGLSRFFNSKALFVLRKIIFRKIFPEFFRVWFMKNKLIKENVFPQRIKYIQKCGKCFLLFHSLSFTSRPSTFFHQTPFSFIFIF